MDYHDRMQSVLDFIETHLMDEMTIEEIARQAHLSVPHLYRIFPYVAGCTVGAYIRRRRLTLSAHDLRHTDRRILDIALAHGFESQESFSRAFGQMFAITPGEYRKTGREVALFDRLRLGSREETPMQPQIITRRLLLAGIATEIDVSQDFTAAFDGLRELMRTSLGRIAHQAEPVRRYGFWMPYYAHYIDYNEENAARRSYFTGVEVSRMETLPGELCYKALPESEYAVFRERERGTMARYAYGVWLPNSNYILNEAIMGDCEVYEDVDNFGEAGECDVMIAVQRAEG